MTRKMLPAAQGHTYEAYKAAGWTDDALLDAGFMAPETSAEAVATDDRLRQLIERVERIEEEIKGVQDDRKDVYLEAKAVGYDVKIMRMIVKLRKMAPDDRKEMEAVLDMYKTAMGLG